MGFISDVFARFGLSRKVCGVSSSEIGDQAAFERALSNSMEAHIQRRRLRANSDAALIAAAIKDLDHAVSVVTDGRVRALVSKWGIEFVCQGTGNSETFMFLDGLNSFPLSERFSEFTMTDSAAFRSRISETIRNMPDGRLFKLMSFDPGIDNPAVTSKTIADVMAELKKDGYRGEAITSPEVYADLEAAGIELNEGLEMLTDGVVTVEVDQGNISFRTFNGMLSFIHVEDATKGYPVAIGEDLVKDSDQLKDVIKRRLTVAWHSSQFQHLLADARNPRF